MTIEKRHSLLKHNRWAVGANISNWNTLAKGAIDLGNCSMMAYPSSGNADVLYIAGNAYFGTDANWHYKTNDPAALYSVNNGGHLWLDAPTGVAGNTATFSNRMWLSNGTSNPFVLRLYSDHASGIGLNFNDTNASPQSFDLGLGLGTAGASLNLYNRTAGRNVAVLSDGNGQCTWQNTANNGACINAIANGATAQVGLSVQGNGARFQVANNTPTTVSCVTTTQGWTGAGSTTDAAYGAVGANNLYAGNSNTLAFSITGATTIFFPNIGTTASAANAFLNSGSSPANQILRSTSSIRYKTNVQTLQASDFDAVMQMRPISFTSTSPHDDPTQVHLGFLAEEMDAIDKRLVRYHPTEWVHGEDGKTVPVPNCPVAPDSVSYERVCVLLVGAVQALANRVHALEQGSSRVAAARPSITNGGTAVLTDHPVYSGTPTPYTITGAQMDKPAAEAPIAP